MSDEGQFGQRQMEAPGGAVAVGERRRHARYAVEGDAEVILADGSQFFRGRILDVSLSGCFIETQARLRMTAGTPVTMVFRANGVMLRTSATVRAIRRSGVGFLFESEPRTRSGLQGLIDTLRGADPARPDTLGV